MVCARERRLLPHDRIEEEEEDGVEGLRCCLNTGARGPFKVPAKPFLTAQFFLRKKLKHMGRFGTFLVCLDNHNR